MLLHLKKKRGRKTVGKLENPSCIFSSSRDALKVGINLNKMGYIFEYTDDIARTEF